jgi:hypothetical protein
MKGSLLVWMEGRKLGEKHLLVIIFHEQLQLQELFKYQQEKALQLLQFTVGLSVNE